MPDLSGNPVASSGDARNLDYFLQQQSQDVRTERGAEEIIDAGDAAGYAAG